MMNIYNVIKVLLFLFIIIAPALDFTKVKFMDSIIIKICILILIIAACFVDFQLAIILTIAFFILLININYDLLRMSFNKKENFSAAAEYNQAFNKLTPSQCLPRQNLVLHPDVVHTSIVPENWECKGKEPMQYNTNNDLFNHYIDDKIKQYDVFLNMITSEEHLNNACQAAIINS